MNQMLEQKILHIKFLRKVKVKKNYDLIILYQVYVSSKLNVKVKGNIKNDTYQQRC